MKKYLLAVLIAIVSIGFISWGVVGHSAVARIAENHLTPKAKLVVKSLLGTDDMAEVSSWADQIIRQPEYKNTASWHYLNVPLGLNYADFVKAVKSQAQENVYTAILKCEAQLKDQKSTAEQKATALKFIIHFVGDLHQPMHISRAEDKGGNTIQVQFNGRGTNLHSLWDSRLIDKQGLTYSEMATSYDTATPEQIKQWQHDDLIKWIYESYQISTQLYAEIEKGNKLDDEYYNKHLPIIKQRIEMGGIRLAGLLNEVCKSVIVIEKAKTATSSIEDKNQKAAHIDIKEVSKHIGEIVTVTSKVYDSKDVGSMVLVNLGASYPNQLLTVVLRGKAKTLATNIENKQITITGIVIGYKGKPEIEITDPSKIQIGGNDVESSAHQ